MDLGSALTDHPEIAYGSLAALVVLLAMLVALRPWPFPPSLSADEINGFARLNLDEGGTGTDAMSKFYDWRQSQWNGFARGLGGLAVALLLAVVGATLETGKVVTETTSETSKEPGAVKRTRTDRDTSPEVFALIAGLLIVAEAAWLRSRALQHEFSADAGRLTASP